MPTTPHKVKKEQLKQRSLLDWIKENPWTTIMYLSTGIGVLAIAGAYFQQQAEMPQGLPIAATSPCDIYSNRYGANFEDALGHSGHTYFVGERHLPEKKTKECIDQIAAHESKGKKHKVFVEQVPEGVEIPCDAVDITPRQGRACVGWDYVLSDERIYFHKSRTQLNRYKTLVEKYNALGQHKQKNRIFAQEVKSLLLNYKNAQLNLINKLKGKMIDPAERVYGLTGTVTDNITVAHSVEFLESFIEYAQKPNVGYHQTLMHYKYLETIPNETFKPFTTLWYERQHNRTDALIRTVKNHRQTSPEETRIIQSGINHVSPNGIPQEGPRVHDAFADDKNCTFLLMPSTERVTLKI